VKGLWILGLVVVGGLVGIGVARWEAKSKSSKFSSSSPSSSPSSSSSSSSPSSSYQPSKSSSPSKPSKSPSNFKPHMNMCPQVLTTCNDGTKVGTPCDCKNHGGVMPIKSFKGVSSPKR
jgi:cytoskeletal protein RodZ